MNTSARRGVRHRALCAAGGVIALAAGCFCGPPTPATELYRIAPARAADGESATPAHEAAPLGGSLAVRPYVTPGIYGGRSIVYRIADHGYGTYGHREWAIPLSEMLGMLTQERLERGPLTTGPALYDPPAAGGVEYEWRGTVREFEEVNRGREVLAKVAFDVQVVRTSDRAVLWTGSHGAERRAPNGRSMESIVATLSALATETVDELLRQARVALRSQAASPPPASGTP